MEAAPSRDEILRQLVTILRRDLKLGSDAPIPPDMPFSGGDIDLDSLDILLLVTSVEKQFGVKIPSSEVGKQVFTNVGTLVDYVTAHAGSAAGAALATAPAAAGAPVDYLARLPHGAAFRFVTRVHTVREGDFAEAAWSLQGDEPFFTAHFPGNPIVPGVLLVEALAQVSGLASAPGAGASADAGASAGAGAGAEGGGGVLAHVDVRFEHPVSPPAEITLRSKLARTMAALQQFDVSASIGDTVVASGSITLHRPGSAA